MQISEAKIESSSNKQQIIFYGDKQVNLSYEYEDNDIYAILQAAIKAIPTLQFSVWICPAVDNIYPEQLKQRLLEQKSLSKQEPASYWLIPYNLGNYHWVGLFIQVDKSGECINAIYFDPTGAAFIPNKMAVAFKEVFKAKQIEAKVLLRQSDGTSCGALTIENLLRLLENKTSTEILDEGKTVALRARHLEILHEHNSKFYKSFNQRQLENKPTVASYYEQLNYYKGKKFNPNEQAKATEVAIKIQSLSQVSQSQLKNAFKPKDGEEIDAHLMRIRDTFKKIYDKQTQDKNQLIKLVFKVTDDSDAVPESFTKLEIISYALIVAISSVIDELSSEQLKEFQDEIQHQIKTDEQIAKQLQKEEDKIFAQQLQYEMDESDDFGNADTITANPSLSEAHSLADSFESSSLTNQIVPLPNTSNVPLHLTKKEYKPGGLRNTLHGNLYQLALLISTAHRAKRAKKNFALVSEANGFEKFDDLVVEHEDRFTFLQAKHTTMVDKPYTLADLRSKDEDASLAKYFDSWRILRKSYQQKPCRFIFFANNNFEKQVNDCLENVKLDDDDFLFEGFNAVTKRFKNDHALKDELFKAILEHSRKTPEKIILKIDSINNIDKLVTEIVNFLIKHIDNSKINIAGKTNKLSAEARALFLSILDFVNFDYEQLKLKGFKPEFGFRKSFIEDQGLDGIAEKVRKKLKDNLKDNKVLKNKLAQIRVICPKNLFKLNKILNQKDSTFTPKGEAVDWAVKDKKGQLALLSLFNQRELEIEIGQNQGPLHRAFLIQLKEIFTSHYEDVPKKYSKEKEDLIKIDIQTFLSELVLKIAQPNRFDLVEIIQEELSIDTDVAPNELYQKLYQYVLNWFANRKCNVLKSDEFGNFMDCAQADVQRFYLLGQTRIFHQECEGLLSQIGNSDFLAVPQLHTFLSKLNTSDNIALVYGPNHSGKKLGVYTALKNIKELKIDACPYMPRDSSDLDKLEEYVIGQSLKVVIIEFPLSASSDKFQKIMKACKKAVENNKKIILLVDAEEQEELLTVNEVRGQLQSIKGMGKTVLEVPIAKLSAEQVKSICFPHQDKYIPIGGRYLSMKSVLDNQDSGLFEAMCKLEILGQILNNLEIEINKTEKSKSPEIFIELQLELFTNVYSLSEINKQLKSGSCVIVKTDSKLTEKNFDKDIDYIDVTNKQKDGKSSAKLKKGTVVINCFSGTIPIKFIKELANEDERKVFLVVNSSSRVEFKNVTDNFSGTILEATVKEATIEDVRVTLTDTKQLQLLPKVFIKPQSNANPVLYDSLLADSYYNALTILDAIPGSGKSTLLSKMHQNWSTDQTNLKSSWIIHLKLSALSQSDIQADIKEFLNGYLTRQYNRQLESWEKYALNHDLIKRRMVFLADGWDEVREKNIEACHELLNRLTQYGVVIVSSRPYAVEKIRLPIVKRFSLKPFDHEQIKDYIEKKLKEYASQVDKSGNFQPEIDKCVAAVVKNLGDKENQRLLEIIGVPLQCYLYCEVIKPLFKRYLVAFQKIQKDANQVDNNAMNEFEQSQRNLEEITATTLTRSTLFQKFILAKLEIYFYERLELQEVITNNLYRFSDIFLKQLCMLAFKSIFSVKSHEKFSEDDLNEINYTLAEMGLLNRNVYSRYEPLHPSYFEYLAAIYLTKYLAEKTNIPEYHQVNEIIQNTRFNKRYQVVWQFVGEISKQGDRLLPGSDNTQQLIEQAFLQPPDLIGVILQQLEAWLNNKTDTAKSYIALSESALDASTAIEGPSLQPLVSVVANGNSTEKITEIIQLIKKYGDEYNKASNPSRNLAQQLVRAIESLPEAVPADYVNECLAIFKNIVLNDGRFIKKAGEIHYSILLALPKLEQSTDITKLIENYFNAKDKHPLTVCGLLAINKRYPLLKSESKRLLGSLANFAKREANQSKLYYNKNLIMINTLRDFSNGEKWVIESLRYYLNYKGDGKGAIYNAVREALAKLNQISPEESLSTLLEQAKDTYSPPYKPIGGNLDIPVKGPIYRTKFARAADKLLEKIIPINQAMLDMLIKAFESTTEDYSIETKQAIIIGLCNTQKIAFAEQIFNKLSEIYNKAPNSILTWHIIYYIGNLPKAVSGEDFWSGDENIKQFCKQIKYWPDYQRLLDMIERFGFSLDVYLPNLLELIKEEKGLTERVFKDLDGKKLLKDENIEELFSPGNQVLNTHTNQLMEYDTGSENIPEHLKSLTWAVDAGLPVIRLLGSRFNLTTANYLITWIPIIAKNISSFSSQMFGMSLDVLKKLADANLTDERLYYYLRCIGKYLYCSSRYLKDNKQDANWLDKGFIKKITEKSWAYYANTNSSEFEIAIYNIYLIGVMFGAALVQHADGHDTNKFSLIFCDVELKVTSPALNPKQIKMLHDFIQKLKAEPGGLPDFQTVQTTINLPASSEQQKVDTDIEMVDATIQLKTQPSSQTSASSPGSSPASMFGSRKRRRVIIEEQLDKTNQTVLQTLSSEHSSHEQLSDNDDISFNRYIADLHKWKGDIANPLAREFIRTTIGRIDEDYSTSYQDKELTLELVNEVIEELQSLKNERINNYKKVKLSQ